MNIWLVTIGEPIPHDKNKLRLHRTGILAKLISENSNHKVIWWTSNFNHFTKEHIFEKETDFNVNQNLRLIALNGKGYKRNVSIDRIIDHKQIANSFSKRIVTTSKPDIIVVAFPTLELCEICTSFGKKHRVPVIIDYRDMWPEVFVDITPGIAKPFIKIALLPLFKRTDNAFNSATGLIGITKEFLKMGLLKASRKTNKYDAIFPLAYLKNQYNQKDIDQAISFWKDKLVVKNHKLRICFFGTLGHQFDFDTIISAVELLNNDYVFDFEIVLCGSGDKEIQLKENAVKLKGVILPGYMGAAQIRTLLELSDIGLCPYNVNKAFLGSIPGKAIEYMSAGLPLLSTLEKGELGNLIDENSIGFHYEFGNPESLARKIKELISKKSELKAMSTKILELYEKEFDAENIYCFYLKHLEFVVKKYNEGQTNRTAEV
jgi:glycosyltransferase involved in cell wall biosynthesis